MRFNNDDYLKAFPREERAADNNVKSDDQPGDVLGSNVKADDQPGDVLGSNEQDPEGGEPDGNE